MTNGFSYVCMFTTYSVSPNSSSDFRSGEDYTELSYSMQ